MPPRLLHPDEYELVTRDSSESNETFNLDEADFESQSLTKPAYVHQPTRLPRWLSSFIPSRIRQHVDRPRHKRRRSRSLRSGRKCLRRPSVRRICFIIHGCLAVIIGLVALTAIFRPSYTILPAHYQDLQDRIKASNDDGRGNPRDEKVFIAASIYDRGGRLVNGAWGKAVLDLIDILGSSNVFLSIYENDSGADAEAALREFETKVHCSKSLIFEEHLDLLDIPFITLPDGTQRTKRIAYLAEARNRALRPLDDPASRRYDKLLYLNDVFFDPVDAAQLLFSTHVGKKGITDYRAACAVDFINPFKFYDTFATRDLEGYSMGVPFFPWFSEAGKAESRKDVLGGKDAVRVKSCWGGMVAFDARWFQDFVEEDIDLEPGIDRNLNWHLADPHAVPPIEPRWVQLPVRFRAEAELFWDASECCLIHADIQNASPIKPDSGIGIYMNPFVRVAYSSRTLNWLRFTRRFEKLYTFPHALIDKLVGLPWHNPRRSALLGDVFKSKTWMPGKAIEGIEKGGSFEEVEREADGSGFCGIRMLQALKEDPREGDKPWELIPVPSH